MQWQLEPPFKQDWKGYWTGRYDDKGKRVPFEASKRRYSSITSRDATTNVGLIGCTKIDINEKTGSCLNCYVYRFPISAQWDLEHLKFLSFNNSVEQLRQFVRNDQDRWAPCRRTFLVDTSDLYHPDVPFQFIEKVHTDLVELPEFSSIVFRECTKRTGRMYEFFKQRKKGIPKNAWVGASIESSPYLWRLDHLAKIQALETRHHIVAWVSCEPMLDDLTKSSDFDRWLGKSAAAGAAPWVWIIGGESGSGARPLDPAGVTNLIRAIESKKYGSAYAFYKQGTSRVARQGGGGYNCPCCGKPNHDQLALDRVQDTMELEKKGT